MSKGFFITGTDTDIGKTFTALALMQALQDKGYQTCGFKPVSAGYKVTHEGLINDDAARLQQASSSLLPYSVINPYAFEAPIAPHIAAAESNIAIEIAHIQSCFNQIAGLSDFVIVEGAGGWLVPINKHQTMADVALSLGLPVILVVGIKLGCLNHTLLSVQSILLTQLPLAGWVANHIIPECDSTRHNVQYLQQVINAPLLANFAYQTNQVTNDHISKIDLQLLNK